MFAKLIRSYPVATALMIAGLAVWLCCWVIPAGRHLVNPLDETVNIGLFGGSVVVTGTGASGAGIPRVTVSNDSIVGIGAGTQNIGHVDGEGTAGTPAGGVVSIQGVAGGTAIPVSATPSSTAGYTSFASTTRDLGAKVLVSAGAHVMNAIWGINTQASTVAFVQCFDSATTAAVTLGTTRPTVEFELYGGGQQTPPLIINQTFSLGIVCASTTLESGSVVSATGVEVFGNFI